MDEQNSHGSISAEIQGAPVYGSGVTLANAAPPLLRPMSTGEVLDRTFALYRRYFWLFVAIAMLPALAVTVTSAARLIYVAWTAPASSAGPGAGSEAIARALSTAALTQAYFLPATILFVVAYGLSHAATVHATGLLTQGVQPMARDAYRATLGHWMRWTGIAFRLFWSVVWPVLPVGIVLAFAAPFARGNTFVIGAITLSAVLLVPAALVFGIINLLRNALGMPAGVEENLGVNAAIRRSRVLVAGRKGRIFLTLLLIYALQTVAGGLQLPFVFLAATTRGAEHVILQVMELVISLVATALVSPVASIALTLLYVDERVRREGYDIELMMQRSLGTAPAFADAGYGVSRVWNA